MLLLLPKRLSLTIAQTFFLKSFDTVTYITKSWRHVTNNNSPANAMLQRITICTVSKLINEIQLLATLSLVMVLSKKSLLR